MCDLNIHVLVDDAADFIFDNYDEKDMEGCQFAQVSQHDDAYDFFMKDWLRSTLTTLAQKSYELGQLDAAPTDSNADIPKRDPTQVISERVVQMMVSASVDMNRQKLIETLRWLSESHEALRKQVKGQ